MSKGSEQKAGSDNAKPTDVSDSNTTVELVYFDIHARGETVRMLYAAANRLDELKDTRVPLFMESAENQREWLEVWSPKAPFRGLPYINIVEKVGEHTFTRQVGHTCPMYVARHLGLAGSTAHDSGVCDTICSEAQSLLGPDLTRTGLTKNDIRMLHLAAPTSGYGEVLSTLEKFVKNLRAVRDERAEKLGITGQGVKNYLVDDRLTLADIAIFNCLDEFINGPRGHAPFPKVEELMRKHYPTLMKTFDVVANDMAEHLKQRQARFTTVKGPAVAAPVYKKPAE